ncbi:hypothetical protein Shyd_00060 [Streptomyces hydrogenans]|uniref:BPP domain-containing protein n=1 Tax=Streptomyces hydrogenans TaxID=1873719 RepID=A0ABQ3P0U2_9ACTN|nr:hypothetical protein Shyd_00060 [Streptomyces hydrogenans]
MVVDPADGTLYAGQEDVGIWRIDAGLTGTPTLTTRSASTASRAPTTIRPMSARPEPTPASAAENLAADVEGLTLVEEADGDGYLLASSQGRRHLRSPTTAERDEDNEYENAFRIAAASTTLDGSEVCDGAAALNAPLGTRYPNGSSSSRTAKETPGDSDREATGFKFVDLGEVSRHHRLHQ